MFLPCQAFNIYPRRPSRQNRVCKLCIIDVQMFAKYLQANENMLRIIANFSGAKNWINI